MSGFDPYLIWLDIPPHERPATYYRLLGLRPLEQNPQVIASAAERVLGHVGRFQQTEHAAACIQLLSELSAARDCLLDPMRKQAYDSGFSQSQSAPSPSTPTTQPAERRIPGAPQPVNPSGNERQIAHAPPVPGVAASPAGVTNPVSSPTTPLPAGGEQQLPSAVVPTPAQPNTLPAGQAAAPFSAPGIPTSIYPSAAQPGVDQPMSSAVPGANYSPAISQPPYSPPGNPVAPPDPAATTPPSWAAVQPTGDVATVTAGQPSPDQPASSPTRHARQLRRTQQTQSAYMLVGIAMAMIVFFFGAILLLAIYLGAQ